MTTPGSAESMVTEAWARIDTWLSAHAPFDLALLNPPADPAAVADAQVEMGLRFPPELIASFACHDGLRRWANMFPMQPPRPIAQIVEHWRMCVKINQDLTNNDDTLTDDAEPWWHPQWIPWAEVDGDAQVIDMRDGPDRGAVRMTCHDDVGLDTGWPSLGSYLTEVADVLDNGGVVKNYWTPYLTRRSELWWAPVGETELNGEPLTPAPRTVVP